MDPNLILLPALAAYAIALLTDWRSGLIAALLLGFVQDPVRKLVPGEPVYLVMLAMAAVVLVAFVAWTRLGGLRLDLILARDRRLRDALRLFVLVVLLQAGNALLRGLPPVPIGIGMMAYFAPLGALWLAWVYARDIGDIRRLLAVYIGGGLFVAVTVWLSYQGLESPLFREVGTGVRIYERTLGIYIDPHVGILRGSELAAWHLAAPACLVLVLGLASRRPAPLALAVVLAMLLVFASTLTGRRKALAIVGGFLGMYFILQWIWHRRERKNLVTFGVLAGFAALLATALLDPLGVSPSSGFSDYTQRAGTVWGDAYERFMGVGLSSIQWALNRGGFIGLGVGAGAQGAQHFGGVFAGGAAEAGLGKITAELGIPGLLVFGALLYAMLKHLLGVFNALGFASRSLANLVFGLTAFLAANLAVFTSAAQIYGDPFVLIILGLCAGFVFAAPKLVQAEALRWRRF